MTPPRFNGNIEQVQDGWNSVPIVFAIHASHSESVCTDGPGETSLSMAFESGAVFPILRASFMPSRRMITSRGRQQLKLNLIRPKPFGSYLQSE